MVWWHSYTSVSCDELMAGAVALAEHGWPVVPGTFWQGRRWAGLARTPRAGSGATGLAPARSGETRATSAGAGMTVGSIPALAGGLAGATQDRATIVGWWSELPYSVLLPTGSVLDAIEVSPAAGRRLSAHLRETGVVAPAGTTPTGRWWFLVSPGEPLRPELASRSDVTLHGRGSWVVAPPSQDLRGSVQWCVPPRVASSVAARQAPSGRIPASRVPGDDLLPNPSRIGSRPAATAGRTRSLPDTYDVQAALLEVLEQRSLVAAAASALGAGRSHRWP